MMGWNDMMGWGWGGMFFGGLVWLLILGAVVAAVVFIVRASGGGSGTDTYSTRRERDKTPLEIVQTRYAKGEIDKEEYETKRRDLEETSSGTGH
jgi:putative membrane protein